MKLATVGDVSVQIRGVSYDKSVVRTQPSDGYLPLLRGGNIGDHGLIWNDLQYVPESIVTAAQVLRKGDIVLAASSGSLSAVGKAARFDKDTPTTFGAFCKALRPNESVDAGYFGHYFKTTSYRSQVSGLAEGANINNLRKEHLDNLAFPVPSVNEQRRIAALLDKADELRTKRRLALSHLDTLTQSIFHSMFGEAPISWPETTIDDLADKSKGSIRTGPFGSQLLTSEFTDEGVAVLGIDNAVSNEFVWRERRFISFEKYDALKRYTVKPGDLLVTIMGTLGRCAVVPDDIPLAINTKHLCCITVDSKQVVPEWLHAYFLRSDMAAAYLRQTTKGAIMGGLNMGIIKKMPVWVPPLELQQTFATRVAAVERLKESHRKHLAELDTLFASLQHRAFKGEP